jgi:hypothetical protein
VVVAQGERRRWGISAVPPLDHLAFQSVLPDRGDSVKHRDEVLASIAGVTGWALVTAAVAELLPARVVYLTSAGLFCLSLFGFRMAYTIASDGLYKLTRAKR